MNIAYIHKAMLVWARERAGLEVEELATSTISADKIRSFEKGATHPTEVQAEVLATKLGIPTAMLYMAEPPKNADVKIPDLRTITGEPLSKPSRNFQKLLLDTFERQSWCKSDREESPFVPVSFVGSFDLEDDPKTVAADMRSKFGLNTAFRNAARDSNEFLSHLIDKAESLGILVMRSAVVGHSTRRKLQVSEFRGFALADNVAPLVFINDEDAEAAQIFTFAHEIAHLWIGASGISDQNPIAQTNLNATESFCDKVAAEFLVPEDEFARGWQSSRTVEQNIIANVRYFRVSSLVVLRRALDTGRVALDVFLPAVKKAYEGFQQWDAGQREKKLRRKKKGGNFWATFELRNGTLFNSTVVTSVRTQRTTYTEASHLLGLSLPVASRYLKRMGSA